MALIRIRGQVRRIIFGGVGLIVACIAALAIASTVTPTRHLMAVAVGATYLDDDGVRFQQSDEDCGVAALEMLFIRHRVDPRLLAPARAMVIARDSGLTMREMSDLAVAHGLTAEGWRMDFDALGRASLPAVVVFPDHYVVVDRVSPNGYVEIRDPGIGRLRMAYDQFLDQWTGEVLLVGP